LWYGTPDLTLMMKSEDEPTVSVITTKSPHRLRQTMKHDASRLTAVLTNIETASGLDRRADVQISRSDFELIRSTAGICTLQARIGDALEQLIHEKDQQLQSTRHQLNESQRTMTRLKRRLQMRDDSGTTVSDATAVAAPNTVSSVTTQEVFSSEKRSNKTFPASAEPFSSWQSLPRSDLEADTLLSNETKQFSRRCEYKHNQKTTEQSKSEFNVKPGSAKEREGSVGRESADTAVPETGAPCHVTLGKEYTEKVVQQNIRLKRILRDLVTERHGSVSEFLVRIGLYHKQWKHVTKNKNSQGLNVILPRGGALIGAGGVMTPTFRGKGGRGDIIWE